MQHHEKFRQDDEKCIQDNEKHSIMESVYTRQWNVYTIQWKVQNNEKFIQYYEKFILCKEQFDGIRKNIMTIWETINMDGNTGDEHTDIGLVLSSWRALLVSAFTKLHYMYVCIHVCIWYSQTVHFSNDCKLHTSPRRVYNSDST